MSNNEKIDLGPKLEYRKEPIPEGEEIPKELLDKIPSIRVTNKEKDDDHADRMDELGDKKEEFGQKD